MYSIEYTHDDPFGGKKIVTPTGQHVSVTVMRDQGAKVSYAALGAMEPMIGYIRKVHDNGVSMAYRYNGFFTLTSSFASKTLGSTRLFSTTPHCQHFTNSVTLLHFTGHQSGSIKGLHRV
jgi:hypothetical protein